MQLVVKGDMVEKVPEKLKGQPLLRREIWLFVTRP
jgi:hypothetical protein